MAKKPKISVVLTPEARALLGEQPIGGIMKEGRSFDCLSVEQNGSFLDMKLPFKHKGESQVMEVSIPMGYVMYLVTPRSARLPDEAPDRRLAKPRPLRVPSALSQDANV